MLKTESQIDTIVRSAKAYYWQVAQDYAGFLQRQILKEKETEAQAKLTPIRNLIKAIEYQGASLADKNVLVEALQALIKKPSLMFGYYQNGYASADYVKQNGTN